MIWKPSTTCACEIEITDNSFWESPSLDNCKLQIICPIHSQLRLEDVPAEVRRENKSISDAQLATIKAVAPDTMVNFRPSFDSQRKLQVDFDVISLTDQEKAFLELVLSKNIDGVELNASLKDRILRWTGKTVVAATIDHKAKAKTQIERAIGIGRLVEIIKPS